MSLVTGPGDDAQRGAFLPHRFHDVIHPRRTVHCHGECLGMANAAGPQEGGVTGIAEIHLEAFATLKRHAGGIGIDGQPGNAMFGE